jgi:hypothetical protein
VISALIAAVLAAGSLDSWLGGKPETVSSTLLLSGLGVVTGLVLRNDEEPLVSELHALARRVLLSVMIAALAAGTAIGLGAHDAVRSILWTVAFAVSAAGAATLSLGALRAKGQNETGR